MTRQRSVAVPVMLLAVLLAAVLTGLSCGPGEAGHAGASGSGLKASGMPGGAKAGKEATMDRSAGLIRESILAGQWYPGEPEALRQTLRGYLTGAAAPKAGGRVLAIVVPHAGLAYSGPVAAYAWRQLEGESVDLVVLVGPSHRAYVSGCAVYPAGAWKTPLGRVEIDAKVAAALTNQGPLVKPSAEAHAAEHSLEIQLPFVQAVCPQARIVPVMMGDQDAATAKGLAQALVAALKGYPGRFVLAASSDLSHFHSSDAARKLDAVVCAHLEKFDPEGLLADLEAGKAEACGGGPIAAVMLAARQLGATRAALLKYADSGDVTGDHSRVVGYAAAAFYGEGGNPGQLKAQAPKQDSTGQAARELASGQHVVLSAAEREMLRRIALANVEYAARGAQADSASKLLAEAALMSALKQPYGAFVTLKRGGELRGCIGHIIGNAPLSETVAAMARAAATQDPRFPPLTAAELKGLSLEISVLTPLEPVLDAREIVVGKHGLYIVYGARRGLLLPQVATEQGWDRETFLDQTCWKAGLPPGAWRDPQAKLYKFGAEVF